MSEVNGFPVELPVDDEVLEMLAHQGSFAADLAFFDHQNDVSGVRTPSGAPQGLTAAEMAHVQIKAALRNLIANGLIEAKSADEVRSILELGVTVR